MILTHRRLIATDPALSVSAHVPTIEMYTSQPQWVRSECGNEKTTPTYQLSHNGGPEEGEATG